MKKTYTAILLTLALLGMPGCSTTEPGRGEFRQGAYRPPARAPAFNPSTDSPITTGQPGHVRPPLRTHEPTPARVLPHTPKTRNEPTIWASRPGSATNPVELLLGMPFEMPGDKTEDDARRHMRACKRKIEDAADASGRTRAVVERRLDENAIGCLAASLMIRCLSVREAQYMDAVKLNVITKDVAPDAATALRFASAWERRACPHGMTRNVEAEMISNISNWK